MLLRYTFGRIKSDAACCFERFGDPAVVTKGGFIDEQAVRTEALTTGLDI